MEVVVFGARRYRFTDRSSGEVREGVRVFYAPLGLVADGDSCGFRCDVVSFPARFWPSFRGVGLYEVKISPTTLRGRPEISDVKFVRPMAVVDADVDSEVEARAL